MSHPGLNSPASPNPNDKKAAGKLTHPKRASVPLPPNNTPSVESEENINNVGEKEVSTGKFKGQQPRTSHPKPGFQKQPRRSHLKPVQANNKLSNPKPPLYHKNDTSNQKDSLEHQPGRLKKNGQFIQKNRGPKNTKKYRKRRGRKAGNHKNRTRPSGISNSKDSKFSDSDDSDINRKMRIDGIPSFHYFNGINGSFATSTDVQTLNLNSDTSLADVVLKVAPTLRRKMNPIRNFRSSTELGKGSAINYSISQDLSLPIKISVDRRGQYTRARPNSPRAHSLLSHSNLPLRKPSNAPNDEFHRPTFTIDDEIIFQDESARRDNPDFYRLTPNHPPVCPRCHTGKFQAEWTPLSIFCCVCVPILGIPCYFAFREYTCTDCGEIWEYNDPREEIDALP
ncbi:unnamed protein product [Allacma fusca]|uniref:Uncharacterized protein n=1 Tax=Allacma fusca TaxID=39272 RepID=A0A8J2P7K4_9HEXA|nr:unnamed protein product [Allacma fusca]